MSLQLSVGVSKLLDEHQTVYQSRECAAVYEQSFLRGASRKLKNVSLG